MQLHGPLGEIIAYGLLGLLALGGLAATILGAKRRKREKLRRRGIKTYGH